MRLAAALALGVALLAGPAAAAIADMSKECPNNLMVNGGFEEPDVLDVARFPKAPYNTYNSKWGWYISIPGWTWNCLRTDWGPVRVFELQHGAVASPAEGKQNAELLPNATGVVCQTINVTPGQKYRLSFYYGRLQTYAWRDQYRGQFIKFETTMDAIARDGSKPAPMELGQKTAPYPQDKQGFSTLITADTRKQANQWQRYETEVVGPASGKLQLAFTTTMRPKECGSCGSLLDAVCLQKA